MSAGFDGFDHSGSNAFLHSGFNARGGTSPFFTVWALSPDDGSIRWTYDTGSAAESMIQTDGFLFAVDGPAIYKIDCESGSLVTTYPVPSDGGSLRDIAIAGDGSMFVCGQKVTKLTPAGAVVWSYPLAGDRLALDGAGNVLTVSANVITRLTPAGAFSANQNLGAAGTMKGLEIDASDNAYASPVDLNRIIKIAAGTLAITNLGILPSLGPWRGQVDGGDIVIGEGNYAGSAAPFARKRSLANAAVVASSASAVAEGNSVAYRGGDLFVGGRLGGSSVRTQAWKLSYPGMVTVWAATVGDTAVAPQVTDAATDASGRPYFCGGRRS